MEIFSLQFYHSFLAKDGRGSTIRVKPVSG